MLKDKDNYGNFVAGTRSSQATATVECGPSSHPDNGCTDERSDALSAYANALAWYISGNNAYAKSAIQLMNKWSYVIKGNFIIRKAISYFCYLLIKSQLIRILMPTYRRLGLAHLGHGQAS